MARWGGSRQGAGRPPDEGSPRTGQITIRATEAELSLYQRLAERLGMSRADVLRTGAVMLDKAT